PERCGYSTRRHALRRYAPLSRTTTTMTTERREWGPLATLLWSVAILILFAAAQIAFLSAYVYLGNPPGGEFAMPDALERLRTNGDVIALATLAGAAVGVPAVFGVMKLK